MKLLPCINNQTSSAALAVPHLLMERTHSPVLALLMARLVPFPVWRATLDEEHLHVAQADGLSRGAARVCDEPMLILAVMFLCAMPNICVLVCELSVLVSLSSCVLSQRLITLYPVFVGQWAVSVLFLFVFCLFFCLSNSLSCSSANQ